jgi:hypothetical protein
MQKRMGMWMLGKSGGLARAGARRIATLLALAGLVLLAAASPAAATFHLIKVREVFAGNSDDSYVELQMFAAGQSLLGGHSMTVYGPTGTLLHSSSFASTVAHSANQQTVLVGDTHVQEAFGVAPDLVDSALSIPASGGAACWNAGGIPADCVAWGNFSGAAALQTATGTSAGLPVSPAGIAASKAIRRTIQPGCPTLLEESDDSDDSANDFSEAAPAPRNNSSAITETTCTGAPNTTIDDRPAPRSNSADASFTYEAPTATSYECRLDAAAFSPCPLLGPEEYTGLSEGSHTFQVRGVNAFGPDPTPAGYTWIVDTVRPVATIDAHPADPSPGATAQFTYHAPNEAGSTFTCSLDGAIPSACAANGITYHGLADGSHSFAVLATDGAGNQQLSATEFAWQVDNSLLDTTPPETTIASKPGDPSPSPTASFTYLSNEPGSTFECSLDSAAFSSCPSAGASYSGLANGPHSFQVRAVDPSQNTDPTPAGYSFSVVVTAQPPAPAPPLSPPPALPAAPPDTTITLRPAAKTRDRTPTFRFRSTIAPVSFQCKLDNSAYRPCRSPLTSRPLSPGRHSLKVRAIAAGLPDPSPAAAAFKVIRR